MTFPKRERLVSKKLMDELFGGSASRSMSAYPLRMVYMALPRAEAQAPVQVLVTVSKRHFKRAVKRNRVKRQVREAYRLGKARLYDALPADKAVVLAFVWLADELADSQLVARRVNQLLARLADRL